MLKNFFLSLRAPASMVAASSSTLWASHQQQYAPQLYIPTLLREYPFPQV